MGEITVTVLQIETTTIKIDSTILVITVGDIITQINIKTGGFKAVTRVTIEETTQITITMRVMVGHRGLSVVDKISIEINSKHIKTTNLDRNIAVKRQLLVEMIATQVIQTINLLLAYLMC